MPCPYDCRPTEGNGPPRPVTIAEVRMMIHDNNEPYSISDEEIEMYIRQAMIIAKTEYNIFIDPATGWPATDLDEYIALLITVINLLDGYMIRIKGGSAVTTGGGAGNGCGGAVYNAVIDSISEGGSSISFASSNDLQTLIDKKREELDRLKIGRWGCAVYVSTGNY